MQFEDITLETPRVKARLLESGDAEELHAIFSDPETMQYWSTPPYSDYDRINQQILSSKKCFDEGLSLDLGLIFKETEKLVGKVALYNINENSRRGEIGYILARPYWRQGLMTEVFLPFVEYCFTCLNLRRLEADIDPQNTASAALLTRTGFEKEGYLKERWLIGDKTADSEIYGLLRRKGY